MTALVIEVADGTELTQADVDTAGEGAIFNIREGGRVEDNTRIKNSTLNVYGGAVGDFVVVASKSEVNIYDGNIGTNFHAVDSTVNISGGNVDDGFAAVMRSTVNISGGSIGEYFEVLSHSTVNASGGTINKGFRLSENSTLKIAGTLSADDVRITPCADED